MVYYAYVNDKEYEPIHFLFASGSINDAYTEIEYVREYTTYRKQQASAIKAAQAALELRIAELEKDKVTKQNLLTEEQDQRNTFPKKRKNRMSPPGLQGEEKDPGQIDQKKKTLMP